jgi:hypothetical protein
MFSSDVTLLVGLIEIVLPSHTIRLCDGGFLDWPGRGMFTAEDSLFGTIESVEAINESLGDLAPSGRLVLLPPDISDAGALFQSDAQMSPIRFWFAEASRTTGLLVGTPELQFDGLLDQIKLKLARGRRQVDIEFMANAERLFMTREGNVLTSRFHQEAWPGEKGFDHCTGSGVAVPWGTSGPGRGVIGGDANAGSGGGIPNGFWGKTVGGF